MILHIIFSDGEEDIFPIERFEYDAETKEAIFSVYDMKTGEPQRMFPRKPGTVMLYWENGTFYRQYEHRAKTPPGMAGAVHP